MPTRDPDKKREQRKRWIDNHPEQYREMRRRWLANLTPEEREKRNAYAREWRARQKDSA